MKQLAEISYQEVKVLTTEQLSEAYETDVKNISNSFNRNKDRFIEGTHYYLLKGEDLKNFKGIHIEDESLKFISQLYLWTERGASRHCKILDTNKAWEQFDYLEDTYFKVKQQHIDTSKLSPELQMFNQMFSVMASQELKINQLEDKTNKVAETMQTVADTFVKSGETENFNKWVNASMDRIANSDNFIAIGYAKYQMVKSESYKRLQDIAHCDLKALVKNAKARAKKAGATVTQQNTINRLSVIANNNRLKAIYTTVVKEMLLAYCVDYVEVVNVTHVSNRLDDDEVTTFNVGGLSAEVNLINESGLYNVILGSDKPQAKQFRK